MKVKKTKEGLDDRLKSIYDERYADLSMSIVDIIKQETNRKNIVDTRFYKDFKCFFDVLISVGGELKIFRYNKKSWQALSTENSKTSFFHIKTSDFYLSAGSDYFSFGAGGKTYMNAKINKTNIKKFYEQAFLVVLSNCLNPFYTKLDN